MCRCRFLGNVILYFNKLDLFLSMFSRKYHELPFITVTFLVVGPDYGYLNYIHGY